MKEMETVVPSGGGEWRQIMKGQEGAFRSMRKLYTLIGGTGYTGVYICQNIQLYTKDLCVSS